MCERIDSIFQEIFPSPEMASYLAGCDLIREDIRDAVAYAPIPLSRKRDLFLRLASGNDNSYFHRQATCIERAIREMQPKPGEFFYLKSCRHFDKIGTEEESLEPYLAWEHILERVREYLGYFEADEQELVWFLVEKWSPDGAGRLKNEYEYTIFGTEVCYFSHISSKRDWSDFSTYNDVYLPVPFRAGDIVAVDCRPFAPVSYAVILEVGDNRDCCCLQALYHNGDGIWDKGAVKHGHVLPNHRSMGLSPLYRLAAFRGRLPEEERLLEKVSQYVNGEEERGSALWNYMFGLYDGRMKRTVTEDQILSYIRSNANT